MARFVQSIGNALHRTEYNVALGDCIRLADTRLRLGNRGRSPAQVGHGVAG